MAIVYAVCVLAGAALALGPIYLIGMWLGVGDPPQHSR